MKKTPTPLDEQRKEIASLYDKYANTYNEDFINPTFHTGRAALSFCNDLTWHYLQKYLPPNKDARLADIGGGDGFWMEKILSMGYFNCAITDISQKMLEHAHQRLNPYITSISQKRGKLDFIKADICEMAALSTNSFDYVFSLFDPVSYSLDPGKAVAELARITKPQSFVVVSLDTKFRRVPELIEAGQIEAAQYLLESNLSFDFQHPQYNLTWEELAEFFQAAGLKVIEMVGAPVFVHQVNPKILQKLEQDPYIRQNLLEMELDYCNEPSLLNNAGHLLFVGQKL